MALSGRAFIVGRGRKEMNPIHEEDLAKVCVDAVTGQGREIPAGGPVVYTRKQMADLAFLSFSRKPKTTSIPVWLARIIVQTVRPFDRRLYELLTFGVAVMQVDLVAPKTGTHTLHRFYDEVVEQVTRR